MFLSEALATLRKKANDPHIVVMTPRLKTTDTNSVAFACI